MSILKYISCFTITALLVSCGEKDSFDITGDPGIKFFTNNESLGNAPQNSISYAVVNIPNTAGAGWVNLSTTIPAAIRFPVMASAPVLQDVTISAVLDNSLIDAYNAEHGTSYLPFPAGMLNTDALSASFAKGGTRSSDSISITTNTAGLNGLTGKSYMAPIKLNNVSNPAAGHITSNNAIQVTYVVANVEKRQIKYNAPSSEALGTLIADRSAWTAVLTPEPIQLSGGGGILDGSTTSFSRWGVSLGQVDINMQTVQAVTGIRLRTSTTTTQTPTQVEVWVSEDGINYELIGAPLRADMALESSNHFILFYKAVNAKYIRLKLSYTTSTSTQNRRVTELDVYAN
jgi:hypothetical protein